MNDLKRYNSDGSAHAEGCLCDANDAIRIINQLRAENEAIREQLLKRQFFCVDVIRCLKTLAFEHNHADIPRYAGLARRCMEKIESQAAKGGE